MANETLGQALARYRAALGMSLQQAAGAAGMSVSYLSDAEVGRRMPTAERLRSLAGVYAEAGCVFEDLWTLRPIGERSRDMIQLERARVSRIVNDVSRKNRRAKSVSQACDEIDERVQSGESVPTVLPTKRRRSTAGTTARFRAAARIAADD